MYRNDVQRRKKREEGEGGYTVIIRYRVVLAMVMKHLLFFYSAVKRVWKEDFTSAPQNTVLRFTMLIKRSDYT